MIMMMLLVRLKLNGGENAGVVLPPVGGGCVGEKRAAYFGNCRFMRSSHARG